MSSSAAHQSQKFLQAVWLALSVAALLCFGISQYFPLTIPISLVFSGLVFITPFIGKTEQIQERLIVAAVIFAILITALYPPVLGFFMGLQSSTTPIATKLLLGLRSAFYATWILAAFVLICHKNLLSYGHFRIAGVAAIICIGILNGTSNLEILATYLLNSFLPLFATIAIVPYVIRNSQIFTKHGSSARLLLVFLLFASSIYFPLLLWASDIFRPDLAMLHQATEGRGLQGRFPAQWQSLIGSELYPRFVGTFPNPILFGYFCAIGSLVFYWDRKWLKSLIFMVATVLTLSKGAILLAAMTVTLHFFLIRGKVLFLSAFSLLTTFWLFAAYVLDGSNRVHLRGLIGGFQSISEAPLFNLLFGFGIGSGGNLARSQLEGGPTSAGWLASGSESGIGVLVYQLGIVGLLVFIGLVASIYRTWLSLDEQLRKRTAPAVALCFAWISNMLLQEDLINVTLVSQILLAVILLSTATVDPNKHHPSRTGR